MPGTAADMPARVILVEDDDAYRYVLARALRGRGLDVLDFRLALDALDHIDRDNDVKAAVIDLRMPPNTLTGLALARMMRFRDKRARVVLMTALTEYLDLPETGPFGQVLLKQSDAVAMAALIHARLGLAAPGAAAT